MSTPNLSEDALFCLSLINPPISKGNFSLPGITGESTHVLVNKLKENYISNNAFFGGILFHNHVMDHLLALWSMGGTAEGLEDVYATHDYQERVKPSPEPITDSNFAQHLGDSTFYSAYLTYFCKALAKSSVSEVLDRFLFSSAYNVAPSLSHDQAELKDSEQHPQMLARLMAGVLHPVIHVGYGAEFGILEQVAEGLAQTAIHPSDYQASSVPLYLFTSPDAYGRGLSKLSSSAIHADPPPFLSFHQALAIDPRLTPAAIGMPRPDPNDPVLGGVDVFKILAACSPSVLQLVNEWYDRWTVGVSEDELEDRLEKMVEDVIIGNVFWYSLSGFAGRGKDVFNADFISMHFVTSAIFLPTLALTSGRTSAQTLNPPLPLSSRLLFIRTLLATSAVWHIARYRPTATNVSISDFYAATSSKITPAPAPHAYTSGAAPHRDYHHNTQKATPIGMTVWPRIFHNAAAHPNDHLTKIVRALAAMDSWYGQRRAGSYGGALTGAEKLDGTFFLRTAILTMDRLGWAYEEKELEIWDRLGYYLAVEEEELQ